MDSKIDKFDKALEILMELQGYVWCYFGADWIKKEHHKHTNCKED